MAVSNQPMHDDLALLKRLALEAGTIALKYFKSENEVWYKNGSSPVSEADKEIDAFLRNSFAAGRPEYGWLSEETEDNTTRLKCETVVIADPIDGTRGFIAGRDEWCISIGIVKGDRPIHSVLHCPALKRTFLASKGSGLTVEETTPYERKESKSLLVTGSKKIIELLHNHNEDGVDVMEFIPSLAYRLALVATGELDGAFARAGASEWDVAAVDLILEEAGCYLKTAQGASVSYNQKNVTVPSLVAARKSGYETIFELAKRASILQ